MGETDAVPAQGRLIVFIQPPQPENAPYLFYSSSCYNTSLSCQDFFFFTNKSPFLFPCSLLCTINPKSTLVFHSVFAPLVPNLFHNGYMYYTRESSIFLRAHRDLAATCFVFKHDTDLDQIHPNLWDSQDLSSEQFNLGYLQYPWHAFLK